VTNVFIRRYANFGDEVQTALTHVCALAKWRVKNTHAIRKAEEKEWRALSQRMLRAFFSDAARRQTTTMGVCIDTFRHVYFVKARAVVVQELKMYLRRERERVCVASCELHPRGEKERKAKLVPAG
jgi:hypothetical protein